MAIKRGRNLKLSMAIQTSSVLTAIFHRVK